MYNHIAVDFGNVNDEGIFSQIKEVMEWQIANKVKVVTVGLPTAEDEKIIEFLKYYVSRKFLQENKVKVSFIGKWYDLPGNVVDEIKTLIEATKDNFDYFFNFVINYDGREEIVDACSLICRKLLSAKISISDVSEKEIKENLYTSNFECPDIIIKIGDDKLNGFLLWDSSKSKMIFAKRFDMKLLN